MTEKINLDNITIVLVRTQIPENIGSVARAMDNMGLNRLVVVAPKNYDYSRVIKPATGPSIEIVRTMQIHDDLETALGPFQYVVGTTARTGAHRPAMTQPRRLANDLIAISRLNQVALVFGPEDSGLTNDQIRYCHIIASIPTARFPSLNIAQAVMIFCYEIFMAGRETVPGSVPRLANKFELEGMYDHLSTVLGKIGFLDPQNPEHWMLSVRRFFSRRALRAGEVRLIRGICRQLIWQAEQFEKLRQGTGQRKVLR